MVQTTSRFFDDIAKLMTNAAGTANSVREEVDALFRAQAERMLNDLDIVQREDFDAVRDMASKARMENEALAKRLVELEARLARIERAKPAPRRARSKPAAKPENK